MLKYNKDIIDKLVSKRLRNVLTELVWIIDFEKVVQNGKLFIKVYNYQTAKIFENIKSIKYRVKINDQVIEIKVSKFVLSSLYNDDNVYGCVLDLSNSITDEDINGEIEINIHSLLVDNTVIPYIGEIEKHPGLENKLAEYQRKLIRTISENSFADPIISEHWWQCTCGKINKISQDICQNCNLLLIDFRKSLNISLDDYEKELINEFVSNRLNSNDIFNFGFGEKSNFMNITRELSNELSANHTEYLYSVFQHKFEDALQRKFVEIVEMPVKWDDSQKFWININRHLTSNGICVELVEKNKEVVEKIIVARKLESDFNEYSRTKSINNSKLNKRNNILLSVLVLILISSVLFYLFALPPIEYNLAIKKVENKDYVSAIAIFSKLGDYEDSSNKLIETKYLKVVNDLDNMLLSVVDIEKVKEVENTIIHDISDYKDANTTQLYRVKYFTGMYHMQIKEYEKAAQNFYELSVIDFQDSKQLRSKALYEYYSDQYTNVHVSITEIDRFIKRITQSSDFKEYNGQQLIDKAKTDIFNIVFSIRYFARQVPTTEELQMALKYYMENPQKYSKEISELKLAIRFGTRFEVAYDEPGEIEWVYDRKVVIDILNRSYHEINKDSEFYHELKYVNDSKFSFWSFDKLEGYIIIRNGVPYIDNRDRSDYFLKPR